MNSLIAIHPVSDKYLVLDIWF